jgi:hypothetical protein
MNPFLWRSPVLVAVSCGLAATGIGMAAPAHAASAQELTTDQTVKISELTPKESAYYAKIADPEVAKNFILTRSYVRLCQDVMNKIMPAEKLPDKPLGFSVRYLLPGEPTMINQAIAASIIAECHSDPKACLGGN